MAYTVDKATLITTYVCTAVALLLILVRSAIAYRMKWEQADYWMASALAPLLARLAALHVALIWGTSYQVLQDPAGLSQVEVEHRVLGSKAILVSRVSYAAFLWAMKMVLCSLYTSLTARLSSPWYHRVLRTLKFALLLTFLAVVLATFLECRPLRLYWQLHPRPAACSKALAQYLTMASTNIATDLCLIVLPLPLIARMKLPLGQKLQLGALFSLGIFVILITALRIPLVLRDAAAQRSRSLWASIEVLAACGVANAPRIYSWAKSRAADHGSLAARGNVSMVRRWYEQHSEDQEEGFEPEMRKYSVTKGPGNFRAYAEATPKGSVECVEDVNAERGDPFVIRVEYGHEATSEDRTRSSFLDV